MLKISVNIHRLKQFGNFLKINVLDRYRLNLFCFTIKKKVIIFLFENKEKSNVPLTYCICECVHLELMHSLSLPPAEYQMAALHARSYQYRLLCPLVCHSVRYDSQLAEHSCLGALFRSALIIRIFYVFRQFKKTVFLAS